MKAINHMLAAIALASALGCSATALAADQAANGDKKPAKDLVLKGDAVCTACHDEEDAPEKLAIGKTRHGVVADKRTPTCTSCHGESPTHVKKPEGSAVRPGVDVGFTKRSKVSVEKRNDACLSCHQGAKRITWQSSAHATRDVACTSCHQMHTAHDKVRDKTAQTEVCYTCHKEQRAQMNRPSHHPVQEGKMACSSCHNVHSDNPKALVKSSTNETCFTCHMEKRGPFVHNHEPVSEDCSICHQPHGTNVANLLKQRPPMLCVQCHGPESHPSQVPALPVGPASINPANNSNARINGTVGRGCLNCHTNIHGGNSTQTNATAERFRR
jgi:DmsE family decaheme c-type cytochrome